MNTRRLTTIISCTLFTSYLIGCSEDAPQRNNRPMSSTPTISSVLVSAEQSQVEVSKSIQLIATAKYSDGTSKDVSNAATWNSLSPTVATVNVLGVVSGLATGNAEIQAEYEGLTGSISITVTPDTSFKELIVTPSTVILAPNDSANLSAFAIRMDDSQVNVTSSVSWSSSDSSLIQVATDGTVTGAAIPGTATITASLPETMLSANAIVTVMAAELVDLEIMPGRATIPLGASARLTALGTFSDGQQLDVTSMVTWSSSSESTASVNNSPGREGEVQSHSLGITSITATDESTGVSNTITVTVTNPAVLRVDVLPRTASIGIGRNQMFEATAIYTDGSEIDVTRRVQWSSSNSAVASVSNQAGSPGLAYGIDVGTTTISALHSQSGVSSDDSATSGQLTVIPAQLTSLVVTPLQVDVNLGNVYQFVATGLYSNGTSRDISASVNWSSSNTAVATVITGTITPGRITTLAEGMSTISATEPNSGISSNDSNRSGELTVLPPLLLSIAVSPSNANMVLTSQQPFQAFGSYSDGSTQDLTSSVVWASTASNIVSVTQSGLATANSLGMASISARETASNVSSDASNESARVLVSEASLVSINVIPTSTTIPAGAISMFMA
ncbi:MAG: Ig-like domain-containing protein, partial [Myxococcota bacterium]|nr:Ig-like domain-containing protein [Myxococcota bacterium]